MSIIVLVRLGLDVHVRERRRQYRADLRARRPRPAARRDVVQHEDDGPAVGAAICSRRTT